MDHKSIVDKLGIRPIEIHQSDFEEQIYPTQYCFPSEVRLLENRRDEMLEALGNIINAMYDKDSTLANLNGHICNAKDMLISKFPEIKELLK